MSQLKLTADSGGGTVAIKAPASTTGNAALELTVPGTASGTILTTNSATGKVLKLVHKSDGTKASSTAQVTGNSFTSGTELSNLTITLTPTDATTVFHITGTLCATHKASYTGKAWVTYQVSGGSEQMITGNADTGHRSTYAISASTDDTTGFSNSPIPINLILDHNTTSAVTVRIRVATTWSSGLVAVNRDLNDTTGNNNDSATMISSLCVTEYVGSAVTATDTTIYRGT